MKIKILIPVYNDWQSVFKLLENINSEVSNLDHEFSVIIVNDASTETKPELSINLEKLNSIKIINMKENKGHARCNAVGLKHIFENEEFDYVIPMDGDGEDRPEEIKQLIDNLNYHPDKPIVGERIRRSEGIFFKFCYFVHKIITSTFTGHSIKYGNYTCLPKSTVEKMINEKATWSSFSGSLAKVEKDRAIIPSERGTRYFGPSKMSFKNLLIHSLSIIGVFKINVLIRSILFLLVYLFLIQQNITIVMLIPILLVFGLIVSVFVISKRENLEQLNNSLSNISNIDILK
ncbi:glycosyltransferase [Candidatus Pelagibacter sp.]|nr:glycosyltransferase [Candidatus Pelagibacter sp.]